MRNTASEGKTRSITALSSCALARSWPKGFSMTTRRHGPSAGWDRSARPWSARWRETASNQSGGMER